MNRGQTDIFCSAPPLAEEGLAGLHVPHWMYVLMQRSRKLLTQRSNNIRRNKERLSGQQPRPESSKHLTNPDVKGKHHQLPQHSYVTLSDGAGGELGENWWRTGLLSVDRVPTFFSGGNFTLSAM